MMKEEKSLESCSHIIVLLCCNDPDRSFRRKRREDRIKYMEYGNFSSVEDFMVTIVPNLTIGKKRSSKLMGNDRNNEKQ